MSKCLVFMCERGAFNIFSKTFRVFEFYEKLIPIVMYVGLDFMIFTILLTPMKTFIVLCYDNLYIICVYGNGDYESLCHSCD